MTPASARRAYIPARILRYGGLGIAVGLVGILTIMVVPLPPFVLDLLLTFNMGFSLVVLLLTLYTREPLEFSVFPSLLLILTLFRLSMNVASTRLILLHGNAGRVISAFGHFVVGGSLVVGLVVFLILVIIQFVVITRGASRIAEVAARFTLDAMPGKQMAIDADVNAGLITEDEAHRRRQRIAREADFYGAMDGASKFVRGDAIAGLIITAINLVGGIAIGLIQRGLSLRDAGQLYSLLTVGDGLVNQIPALIISTAAGIIVTRATSEGDLGSELLGQVLLEPRAAMVAAVMLGGLGLVPGLPTLPFLLLAAGIGTVAMSARRSAERASQEEAHRRETPRPTPVQEVGDLLEVDPLELEIGYGLISLVEPTLGGDLLDRISIIRRQIAMELGIVVPPIRIRDNTRLRVNEYVVKLRGVEVARGEIIPQAYLAMSSGTPREVLRGTPTTEPVFGLPAFWIGQEAKDRAEMTGYTVVEAPAVLATHLTEVLKKTAHELLTRQDVHSLVETIKKSSPAVVEELIPAKMNLGSVQKVLQLLLRERVSIRDLTTILETLADYAPVVHDTETLAERVRQAMARSIARQYAGPGNKLLAVTLDPHLEEELRHHLQEGEGGRRLVIPPELGRDTVLAINGEIQRAGTRGEAPVVLTHPVIRPALRRLLEPVLPRVGVLSYAEVVAPTEAVSVGLARRRHAA